MTKKINLFTVALCLMCSGIAFGSGEREIESEDVKTLRIAIYNGYEAFALTLIDQGTPIDSVNDWGNTVLHDSARCGDRKITSALISKGADVNAQNKRKKTPLYCAVSQVEVEMVSDLLDANADPHIADEDGITPLYLALRRGLIITSQPTEEYVECFELLLPYSMYKEDGELHFLPDRNGHTVSEIFRFFECCKTEELSPEERKKAEEIKSEYGFDSREKILTDPDRDYGVYDDYPKFRDVFNKLKDEFNIKRTKSARK